MSIQIKRAYTEPSEEDGYRVLIDRLWPRGVKKEDLQLDEWLKEVAPSDGLRKWFHHEAGKFSEFKERYLHELEDAEEALTHLLKKAQKGRLTLVYGAKNEEHNQAVILKELLEQKLP